MATGKALLIFRDGVYDATSFSMCRSVLLAEKDTSSKEKIDGDSLFCPHSGQRHTTNKENVEQMLESEERGTWTRHK